MNEFKNERIETLEGQLAKSQLRAKKLDIAITQSKTNKRAMKMLEREQRKTPAKWMKELEEAKHKEQYNAKKKFINTNWKRLRRNDEEVSEVD